MTYYLLLEGDTEKDAYYEKKVLECFIQDKVW